jgi:hypothetical protein
LYCVIGFVMLNVIGNIILITVPPNKSTRGGLIVAFYMMQALGATNPAAFLMLSRNSAGQTKKSITYAVTYIGWAGGNAAAPQVRLRSMIPGWLTETLSFSAPNGRLDISHLSTYTLDYTPASSWSV